MCGICGEVRFDGAPVASEIVVAMRDQLVHRGPDAAGLYVSPSRAAGLGFRRLSIVDLSPNGHQPMPNEDGTVQVVFNGEIYNFAGIRDDLISRGHRFRSRSDSEVIVHLYEELGPACIDRLDGMFAIGIWDERERLLTLARDRAGKKPLFYMQDRRRAVFASEIKAFFPRRDVAMTVDREMVPYYFLYGYVPCPRTLYHGVEQVEPGSVVTIDRAGRTSSRRYWALKFPPDGMAARQVGDRAAVKSKLRDLMTAAVERRLMSDVPLGAFLSGGVDSTIVVGLMSRLLDRPVKTFSIGFKDSPSYDETAFARLAATRFKTDHTEFIVEPSSFDLIEKLVWHHDGPFGDSSAVPTYIVSQLTRRSVTVVLNGDGGDELFAGYLRFYAAMVAERMPRALRGAVKAAARLLPAGENARHRFARARRFADAMSLPLDERITRWTSLFYDDLDQLLTPDFQHSTAPVDPLRYLRSFEQQAGDLSTLSRVLLINFNTYLLNDLLVKVDRSAMANSLEARSPFLDTALMEYAASLPDSMKLARGRTKVILREAFADLIPPEIQRRGKMGFGIPFGEWFRGALKDPVNDLLLTPDARYKEYLSADYVHRLVERHQAGEADLGLQLWTLFCFEIWLRDLPGWTRSMPAAVVEAT
jgi:asparagine synthase (glutamine-hydrolysing)